MMHFDFQVGDLDSAVAEAVALGASVATYQPQDNVRVLFDPAGHPLLPLPRRRLMLGCNSVTSVGLNPPEVTLMARVAGRLPTALLHRPLRVLRPQDAAEAYVHPRPEFARLARSGALHRLANGYYAVVPDDQIGRPWLPELESAALGIAAADQGVDQVALMGLSAARVHGAIPRALGVAVVATTGHRRSLRLTDRDATIVFVRRKVAALDLERHGTDLGQCWTTTVEQTLLDLAARPDLGRLPHEARTAVRALLPRADPALLRDLAEAQRRRTTLDRVLSDR